TLGTRLQVEDTSQCRSACADTLRSGLTASAAVLALFFISGCAGPSVEMGGRPLIYRVGPGDPPSSIHSNAGVVYKERGGVESAAAPQYSRPQVAQVEPPLAATAAPPTTAPAPASASASAPAPAQAATLPVAPATAGAIGPSALDARYTQATRYGD